jgi:hypothetical protein
MRIFDGPKDCRPKMMDHPAYSPKRRLKDNAVSNGSGEEFNLLCTKIGPNQGGAVEARVLAKWVDGWQ